MSPRGAPACSQRAVEPARQNKKTEQAGAPKPVILGKTLPNITHAFLKAGRHNEVMTKTRRAFIIILEQTYNSRKRPPCFLILADVSAGGRSRAPSPPRVRVSLSVVLGQYILESSVTRIPLYLANKTHTLRVRATRAKHDRWGLRINGKSFLFRPHLGASPLRSGFPPAHPSARLGRAVFMTKACLYI